MPNWVKNKVRAVNKNDTAKLIAMLVKRNERALKDGGDELLTNFNGIIPTPDELRHTEHSTSEDSKKKMAENEKKFGYQSWYDFACDKWGTKWDNLNVDIVNGEVVEFDSAWCIPYGIYMKISETIPIIVAYADEDIGYNCNIVKFDGGERILVEGLTMSSTQLANAIWGYEYDNSDGYSKPEWYSEDVSREVNKIIYG